MDIGFRVPGLSHAVVKEVEHFRVQELVKKIESLLHREARQADLQQNNVYNPFSEESKVMIREMGNLELFELCQTIPKVQCSECHHCWNQGVIYCTCGHLLTKSEASQQFHHWRLDALSIPRCVIKKGRHRGARHGKNWSTERAFHRPRCAEEMSQKEIWRNSRSLPNEIQHFVIRSSKLAGPRRSASQWINWHRKTTSIAYPMRSMRDEGKTGISHWTNQKEMHRWNSD